MHQHASHTKTRIDARVREGFALGVCSPKSMVRSIDSSVREESYSFVYYEGDELSAVQSGLALAMLSVSSFPPRLLLRPFFFSFSFSLRNSVPLTLSFSLSLSLPSLSYSFPLQLSLRNVWTGRPIVNVKINSPPPFPTFFFRASTPRSSRTQTHSPARRFIRSVGKRKSDEPRQPSFNLSIPFPPSYTTSRCVCGKLDHIPAECITTT